MSVINKILGGALLIGGLATTTGCSDRYYEHNTVDGQVKKMMSDRPYSEYQQATAQWRTKYQGIADAQNTLDSVGYRRVFESTQGVKDSAMVAEFNNIAASTRVPDSLIKPQKIIDNLREHLYDEKLADVEILCVVIQCHIKLVPIVQFHKFRLVVELFGIIFVIYMIHGDFKLGTTDISNHKLLELCRKNGITLFRGRFFHKKLEIKLSV